MLKEIFGSVKHQEEATCGLGYKLTLSRNKDDAVLDKASGSADARIEIDLIRWYVPHYTPSFPHQIILTKQFLIRKPT